MAEDLYVLPMSPAQQRLWFLDQMDPGTTMFNIPAAFRLHGPLDPSRVARVLSAIVERHEVLRTTLTSQDGEAVQVIHPYAPVELPVTDLSALGADMRESALLRELRAAAAQPFDLARGPLFRPALWRLSGDDHVLMLGMHHAISDGWSLGVLTHEFSEFWLADLEGRPAALPPLSIQYADYSHWHRERMLSGELDGQRRYWLDQLTGHRGILRLPTDRPRPSSQTFNAGACEFRLPERVVDAVRAFSKDAGVTLFMSCMSAYALLLSRYSGQQDLFVGIPAAGRTQAELEPLVGFFVNALVIRVRIDPAGSVRDLVTQVRRTVLDAFSHQDFSLDALMEALEIERHPAFEPLVQATFALQNLPAGARVLPDIDVEPVHGECMHSRYDLMLLVSETPEGLTGNMVYNTDLFDHDTIARMMQHLERVLEAMAATPDASLASLSLVTPAELYDVLDVQPDRVERIVPLTPMQRDLYVDSLANHDSHQNAVGLTYPVTQPIDLDAWRGAAQALADTQPVMRTRMRASSAAFTEPVYQCVMRHETVDVEVIDLSASSRDRQPADAAEIDATVRAMIQRPYDPHGVLVRHFLVKLADDRWIAGFANHHMVLDGIATVQAATWVAAEYTRRTGGATGPDVLGPSLFHDAVPAIRAATDRRAVLDRWQALLAGVAPLAGPSDVAAAGPSLVSRDVVVPDALWTAVRQYCRQRRITPQIFMKCVFALAADAHLRCEGDLLVQEFLTGRGPGHAAALGCYYQGLPFVIPRRHLGDAATCAALFDYAKQWQRQAPEIAGISLFEQRRLAPPGRVSLLFNFITAKLTLPVSGDVAEIHRFTPYADGVLQFEVSSIGDDVHLSLTYDRAIFAESQFLERTMSLMGQIAGGADAIAALSLQLPEETGETTEAEAPREAFVSIPDRIREQARLTPDAPAVLCGEVVVTYRDLMVDAARLAQVLAAAGVGSSDRVGICLERSPRMIVALVAVLDTGAAYVPMDAAYPDGRLRHMATDAECRLVITETALAGRFSGAECRVLLLDDPASTAGTVAPAIPFPSREPDSAFYVLYTSGSTGTPKGATVNDRGEWNLVQWYTREFGISASDRFLIISAFGFDLTQKNFFAALTTGAALVLPETALFDPADIAATIRRHGATIVNCAPSAFYSLVEEEARWPELVTLRHVFLGGEPIRVERLAAWLARGQARAEVVNTYGPTECTDVVSYFRLREPMAYVNRDVPLGDPVDHVQLHVIDDLGRPLPPFGVGELCISGIAVGPGYWRQPELTDRVFVPNPFGAGRLYRTGDLAYRLPDGKPVYSGRRDFQVKVRGLRIELGEIEAALRDATGLDEWMVLAVRDVLIAYVRTDAPAPDVAALHRSLGSRLPAYMLPQHVIRIASWPLSPNGKVDRDGLARLEPPEGPAHVVALPETDTERRLAQLWHEVIDQPARPAIGRDESFFSIGGHSLLAARLAARIRTTFAIDLPLRVFFEAPTIAAMGQHIDRLTAEALGGLSEQELARLLGGL